MKPGKLDNNNPWKDSGLVTYTYWMYNLTINHVQG